ncbi:MAG TPA: glycosyltransferase [Candidatus Rubrimentiphilum sp.]|nr:glycosyltransferase [Candidatus Rubrimentiphilum sp.]
MSGLDLSIVIPAFKEAHKIPADIAAADEFLTRAGLKGEIILVNDGSTDATLETARALQAQYPRLAVLSYRENRGKGHALKLGMNYASGRFLMFADAGLCVPYDIARIALTMLELDMCDIAHGSRRMRGSVKREQPLYRRLGARAFALLIHTVVGVPRSISDTQCGFKLYRRAVAKRLYSELVTDGFMFDVEIILRALQDGYRILEFPVLWTNDADTRMNPMTDSGKFLRDLAAMRLALARGTLAKPPETVEIYSAMGLPDAAEA